MIPFRADLHCHSTQSDGTLSPHELLLLAKQEGLSGLAITDHDTISSFDLIAQEIASQEVDVIPGVELSTTYKGENIHILGYAFDPANQALIEFCHIHRQRRLERNRQILEKLAKKGMILEEAEIQDIEKDLISFGRPHIALALIKKGYVKDIQEAFKLYLGERKSCYVAGDKWSVEDAIDVIHEAKGKAVIAHPHIIAKNSIVRSLLEMNFDGIEAYYSRFGEQENKKWVQIAEKRGLFVTGGSDFHGSIKPDIRLGISFTPESVFVALKEHFWNLRPEFYRKR